jgi:hypothetical protein
MSCGQRRQGDTICNYFYIETLELRKALVHSSVPISDRFENESPESMPQKDNPFSSMLSLVFIVDVVYLFGETM